MPIGKCQNLQSQLGDAHFKKGTKMDDDNPAAYKPALGDVPLEKLNHLNIHLPLRKSLVKMYNKKSKISKHGQN